MFTAARPPIPRVPLISVLLALTLTAVVLCGVSCGVSSGVWLGPARLTVLRIGVDNAPPFHVVNPDGSVEGMAVDVFTEAARRRHIRIVWVPWLNSTSQLAFASGRVDAWPAVSRTPERERIFHFTEPWIQSDYYLVTRKGSGITQRNAAGIKLSVAGFGRLKIVASRFVPGSVVTLAKSHAEALQDFCVGRTDAALVDARALDTLLLSRPEGCGRVALRLDLLAAASNPVSIASTPATAAIADSLSKGIMELARDGGMWGPIDKWSGFSAAQTRSFFALREVESRRDLYLSGFAAVTLSVIVLGWAISRLRAARKRAGDAQRAAADSEARFQAFMDHTPLVGFIKDERGRMIYVNRRYRDVFGHAAGECLGKDDFELWPAETAIALRQNDARLLASGQSMEFIETTPVREGETVTWLSLKFPFRQGPRTYLGGMCIDVTERERAREDLRISEERFRSLFSHATVGIMIAGHDGRPEKVNSAFCRILRMGEAECLANSAQDLLDDGTGLAPDPLHVRAAAGSTFERRLERHGVTLWTENCVFAVRDAAGQTVNIVAIVEDITQRKIAEENLAYQARHDLLTGLTNRRAHETYLEEQIVEAAQRRRKVCLLYVDLDDFKIVNDTLGHDAGDLVLQEAALRLSSLVADKHSLSRIGGDEFVLVQSVENRDEAHALSSRLRLAMEQPFQINGVSKELRASAGFSVFPDDGLDARTLRKKADDAMYAAKRMGKSTRDLRPKNQPLEAPEVSATLQGEFDAALQGTLEATLQECSAG